MIGIDSLKHGFGHLRLIFLLLQLSRASLIARSPASDLPRALVPEVPKVPIVTASHDKSLDSFGEHADKPTLGSLKRSVFRITVYRKVFRWSRPFDDHYVVGSLGSGFLVSDNPLTVCTCAHVVRGASAVYLQVTDFGKTKFSAQVETINNYADVALITFKDPKALLGKLKEGNITIQPLRFANKAPKLGLNVVAPGFPLGQETLTLSTGVISGVDHVSFHYTNLAIQSTAIISSGNSGSPLLDADTLEVIGMNYAKKVSEAQINYVVALWRLKQTVLKHKELHGKAKDKDEKAGTYQFRLVEHGLVTTPGVDALYMLSKNSETCGSGPLISQILPVSPFHDASPPIPANAFLVSIDGVKLDRYGQGMKKEYVDELVDFSDLMWMRTGTGEEDIVFETCDAATGKSQEHKMSMAWQKDREGRGVQYVYDPRLDKVQWEIYGDLIFMALTENHINIFGGDFHNAAMIRFLEPERRQKPKLAVMLLKAGGEAQEALQLIKGNDLEIVESINGHEVNDLDDYRQHFFPDHSSRKEWLQGVEPSGGAPGSQSFLRKEQRAVRNGQELIWSLKTASGKEYATLFVETLKSQAVSYSYGQRHLLTPAAKDAMLQVGLFSGPKKKSLIATPQDNSVTDLDVDSVVKLGAEPLEFVERQGNVAMVDFAKNEQYDVS